MVSIVDICNDAIDLVGGNNITSLSDGTTEATWFNSNYNRCRRSALYMHPWNFARKRASLNADVAPPEFQYNYQCTLPSDCLRVWATEDQLDQNKPFAPSYNGHLTVNHAISYTQKDSFKVEKGKLLTDSADIKILYIFDNEDTTSYSPLFVTYLATFMAHRACYKFTHSNTRTKELKVEMKDLVEDAKSINGQEGTTETTGVSGWAGARM